jgi:hypothetical protein
MNHTNFYKYISFGLLLLNICIVAFFVITKPKSPSQRPGQNSGPPPGERLGRNNGFESQVIKVLNLNEKQESSFREYAREHNDKLKSIAKQQEVLLLEYFDSVNNTSNPGNKEVAIDEFQKLDREKLEVTHKHLMDLKNLLNEDQFPRFNKFMEMFTNRIIKKNNPPPPRKSF